MIPIVYHPGYNFRAFGLERLHPFDGRKYVKIREALVARGLRKRRDFLRPKAAGRLDLILAHDEKYLDSLVDPGVVASILEIPQAARLPAWAVDRLVLRRMRLAAGGTILAARLALEHGFAINLGGGFHHARRASGAGFCVYADIPIAARVVHDSGLAGTVLVVDLDAHQGDGTASIFRNWLWALIYDLFQEDIFPGRKEAEDFRIPVASGLTGEDYLEVVEQTLPAVLDRVRPDLVIYNAGSDPFVEDPLAGFRLTGLEIAERDLLVATLARDRGIPVAMVLSGGYSPRSWQIHADAIEGILVRFDPSTSR